MPLTLEDNNILIKVALKAGGTDPSGYMARLEESEKADAIVMSECESLRQCSMRPAQRVAG